MLCKIAAPPPPAVCPMTERLQNINVASSELLPTPEQVKQDLPLPVPVASG